MVSDRVLGRELCLCGAPGILRHRRRPDLLVSPPRQETRENIVQAGAQLFAQKHYESVCMAELLTEAGITQGGFYFHFPRGEEDSC